MGWIFVLAAATAVLDQVTKAYARTHFASHPIQVIPHVLSLVYTENTGAAFSLFTSETRILTAISLIAVFVVICLARSARTAALRLAYGLLLGGIVGDLIDRLLRGRVIDFIRLPHWPVFNLADAAITVGGVILAVVTLKLGGGKSS